MSEVVKPLKVNVPEVFPVMGVVEFAVTSCKMMVLDTALGSGVYVTLTDDGVTWESVGAAGWASCGSVNVSGADTVPCGDEAKFTPSPMEVIVAS